MEFRLNSADQTARFKSFCNDVYTKYKDTEKVFYVDIKEGSEIRSVQQNNYYWAVVVPIAKEVIHQTEGRILEPELVHENLKLNFGTQVFGEDQYWHCFYNGMIISWSAFEQLSNKEKCTCERRFSMPSTTKMSTRQFNEYIQHIQEWAAFSGFEIPDPV